MSIEIEKCALDEMIRHCSMYSESYLLNDQLLEHNTLCRFVKKTRSIDEERISMNITTFLF